EAYQHPDVVAPQPHWRSPPAAARAAHPAARRSLATGWRQRLHRNAVVGDGAEPQRVGGALDAQPQLVAGHGVARRGEDVPDAELDVPVTARLRERHLQAILSLNVAHLDLELPVDAACKVVDDPPRFLP